MVNWESKADRGPRSPIRSRARGGDRQSKPRSDREKTPQPAPEPKPAAPRGSPIANKLGRHAPQAWTSIPVPQQTVHVRTSPPLSAASLGNMHAPVHAPCPLLPRTPLGATVPHRRRLASRAGSPTHWAPRLAVPPSGHQTPHGTTAFDRCDPSKLHYTSVSASRFAMPYGMRPWISPKGALFPFPCIQAGERALGVSPHRCSEGKSYSGPLTVHPNIPVRALHCNGLHPSPPDGEQEYIYMMTCSPLSAPEDLKVLIKEGISLLSSSELVQPSYEALQFFLSPGDSGTQGLHLLVGLQVSSEIHMNLRDVLLRQPDYHSDGTGPYSPWLEPPFAAPSVPPGLGAPRRQRSACETAELLKARFRPPPIGGKKPKEFRWVTTCLTSNPTEDTSPRITDWEASASLFVAVDILTHNSGIRHSGLEGQSSSTARSLLVLIACRLQQLLRHPSPNPDLDMGNLADLAESSSFSEVRKRTQQSRFCSVLCETTSDQDTLLNSGGLVIPLGSVSLYVSFSPTMDDTIRTSLPREMRIALRNHKNLFYLGGLVLTVTSSIPLTPPPAIIPASTSDHAQPSPERCGPHTYRAPAGRLRCGCGQSATGPCPMARQAHRPLTF